MILIKLLSAELQHEYIQYYLLFVFLFLYIGSDLLCHDTETTKLKFDR